MSSASVKRGRSDSKEILSKKSKAENGSLSVVSSSSTESPTFSPFPVDVKSLKYISGFGAHAESEALPGTLPHQQNTPQKVAHGLYAEQLSGTSFTTPRDKNQRSWLYRIRPTAAHKPFQPVLKAENKNHRELVSTLIISDFDNQIATPNQLRWKPIPMPASGERLDFIQGIKTIAGAGKPDLKDGLAIHVYACNTSMTNKALVNSDGDFLIVPQEGELLIRSEFGWLHVPPTHIAVIQRGIAFSVHVTQPSRGYICEVFNGHFRLPELGPIGANGLANPRDFQTPVASYEDRVCEFTVVQKYMGSFWFTVRDSSVFDVVGWHGNYAPYKYDLNAFCPAGAVLFDHLDPSIFTVLTVASSEVGVAVCDFVIFPPRYAVQEHTFRPPYYHRNCMSEYMGNICGKYEAKPDGFLPGGGSLHSCMVGHGPDSDTFNSASNADLKPHKLPTDALAFMFESTYLFRCTDWALQEQHYDPNYYKCWMSLPRQYAPGKFLPEELAAAAIAAAQPHPKNDDNIVEENQ